MDLWCDQAPSLAFSPLNRDNPLNRDTLNRDTTVFTVLQSLTEDGILIWNPSYDVINLAGGASITNSRSVTESNPLLASHLAQVSAAVTADGASGRHGLDVKPYVTAALLNLSRQRVAQAASGSFPGVPSDQQLPSSSCPVSPPSSRLLTIHRSVKWYQRLGKKNLLDVGALFRLKSISRFPPIASWSGCISLKRDP